jgi:hypothetical protein
MNRVKLFSRFMAEGLDQEHWGTIEPELFYEIAENNSFEDMSEDARSLASIIQKAMRSLENEGN